MQIKVLVFGYLRESTGRAEASVSVPDGATVGGLLDACATFWPAIEPYFDVIAVALNEEYASRDAALHGGDTVALIPPVSGGAPEGEDEAKPTGAALLTVDPIDVDSVVAAMKHAADGAVVAFEGIVRNQTRGRKTLFLEYEAYEEMALKQMSELVQQALNDFSVRGVALVHRLGRLEISETSVLIVVAAAHRGAAFDACRWLIDTLKKKVPIWKREHFVDGAVWADGEPFPADVPRAGVTETPGDASK